MGCGQMFEMFRQLLVEESIMYSTMSIKANAQGSTEDGKKFLILAEDRKKSLEQLETMKDAWIGDCNFLQSKKSTEEEIKRSVIKVLEPYRDSDIAKLYFKGEEVDL